VKTLITPALSTSGRYNLSCAGPIRRGEDAMPRCIWFMLGGISWGARS
ncbi:hypothetical protein A2U01_0000312, partial [Trifolium medium]|nr:hypothetical protein [Trifolium medium]